MKCYVVCLGGYYEKTADNVVSVHLDEDSAIRAVAEQEYSCSHREVPLVATTGQLLVALNDSMDPATRAMFEHLKNL